MKSSSRTQTWIVWLPLLAACGADAPPPRGAVIVEVTECGEPVSFVDVAVTEPDGVPGVYSRTDSDGRAEVDVVDGAMVTVIEEDPAGQAFTYVGVAPGDVLRAQLTCPAGQFGARFDVELAPFEGASSYDVCNGCSCEGADAGFYSGVAPGACSDAATLTITALAREGGDGAVLGWAQTTVDAGSTARIATWSTPTQGTATVASIPDGYPSTRWLIYQQFGAGSVFLDSLRVTDEQVSYSRSYADAGAVIVDVMTGESLDDHSGVLRRFERGEQRLEIQAAPPIVTGMTLVNGTLRVNVEPETGHDGVLVDLYLGGMTWQVRLPPGVTKVELPVHDEVPQLAVARVADLWGKRAMVFEQPDIDDVRDLMERTPDQLGEAAVLGGHVDRAAYSHLATE